MDRDSEVIMVLAGTAQAMGSDVSTDALKLMVDDLAAYPVDDIKRAASVARKKGGRFSVSRIVDHLVSMDGRPSADRAWAMVPKDEELTEVCTKEMLEAWSVASGQYEDGDEIGAQIAFKREYQLLVDQARDEGQPIDWIPSLGFDPHGRDSVLIAAAADGRLAIDHTRDLISYQSLPALANATKDEALMLEVERYKALPPAVVPDKVREELKKSPLGEMYLSKLKETLAGGNPVDKRFTDTAIDKRTGEE